MGDGVSPMNNWTIWCTQNVLMTAALWEEDEEISRAILQKAAKSADFFLAEYGDDGCCDEGPQYYRHAGLCLFNTIEIMNGMTDHSFSSLYREPKICNIAAYLSNVHACGPYYINFSDCAAVAGLCSAREYLFGKRTEQKELMELAAGDCRITQDPLLTQEHNLFTGFKIFLHCLKSFLSLRAVIQKKRYFLSQYRPFYCKRQPFLSGCKSRG